MAGRKEQFDEFLGGSEQLPPEIHIMKLVSARASEIAAMTYSIENPQQTKLVFQKLPVYMRRRVMSHNMKRLPRRLQEAHLSQMTKSGLPPKAKRPSRKYRRRPRNLLAEYNRRQRNKIWLETHIWHAKRFHMVEKWGYRIASFANDKCFRANYRAVARHCLMQDISYYTCVEISGPEQVLKETLKTHCNPCETTFAAKIFTTGQREGTVMFFKKNSYPRFPIGHVHFLWRPSQSTIKTIWIWVHPSFIDDFIAEITFSFEFKCINSTSENSQSAKCTSFINERDCKLIIHRGTLNRFRFYGPLTMNVLTNAFHVPNFDATKFEDNQMDCDEEAKNSDKLWHVDYYNNQEHRESLKVQKNLWQMLKSLQSPSQLPPNIVLGFTVLDPRFYLPDKRTKLQRQMRTINAMPIPPANANASPIWEQEIRQKVSRICATTSAINKLRSQCLVPGTSNDKYFDEQIMAKIPILLIQRPGIGTTGLGSGVDIIVPSNWAMPFWLACILRCVRIGALRESTSIAFEYQNMRSPDINDPDTPAYESPFFCEWKLLMKEWTGTEEFSVLRNRKLIQLLHRSLTQGVYKRKCNKSSSHALNIQDAFEDYNYLVRVKVSILKKGCPKRFAIISMPTDEDVEKFKNSKTWSGPVEKLNIDPNESARKILRKNHSALLKRLKRQRIRYKKASTSKLSELLNGQLESSNYVDKSKKLLQVSREAVNKQSQRMSEFYLPDCNRVRFSCDREIIGYVTIGDFSFSEAKGIGSGYVTLNSLIELINKQYPIVLVRNIQTRQYRIAKLEVTI
ncbi:ribonucleases P/MRP protein subunit POP1 isoform X2 [Ceratina calcarata]|uniref:Ribonucleases P/MRP protein subunit POP1 isoform X2 n=1 Tax=Ceratina calcarata TaxID=156304 RepID=A0AAJ7RWU2_9HYME|nr:ribonucleases P/MRP protein subunit POP1 isoform X2 [Ceratina calcarata]